MHMRVNIIGSNNRAWTSHTSALQTRTKRRGEIPSEAAHAMHVTARNKRCVKETRIAARIYKRHVTRSKMRLCNHFWGNPIKKLNSAACHHFLYSPIHFVYAHALKRKRIQIIRNERWETTKWQTRKLICWIGMEGNRRHRMRYTRIDEWIVCDFQVTHPGTIHHQCWLKSVQQLPRRTKRIIYNKWQN